MTDKARLAREQALDRIKQKKAIPKEATELLQSLTNGNRNALSQAITIIESSHARDRELANALISEALPHAGNSIRIGITGVPGVGKSTFIESFGQMLLRKGRKIAVLAIDPTSGRHGGSILGDKTRMEILSSEADVFIRPSPSSQELGGVARKTRETILLCEAAGYDTILVETVGVGQSEIAVNGMTDFFLLLMLAGAGDELQGIKRGIMEMADALVITKADEGNETAAKTAARTYKSAMHLLPPSDSGQTAKAFVTSAIENKGLKEVWEAITQYEAHTKASGYFGQKRGEQNLQWLKDHFLQRLEQTALHSAEMKEAWKEAEQKVMHSQSDPFVQAEALLQQFLKGQKEG